MFKEYKEKIEELIIDKEFIKYQNSFSNYNNIIILGNGGSNSIASHISQDMTKFHNKKTYNFSDPSLITCFSNDFGYENALVEFLKRYGSTEILVIIISSSGESRNMINAIKFLEYSGYPYGILTGFKVNNTLRKNAKSAIFDYHVKSENYGVVECTHQIFLHGAI